MFNESAVFCALAVWKATNLKFPNQQPASVSKIFVIKCCQGNMFPREVLSQSHFYPSEPMWLHTLTRLS